MPFSFIILESNMINWSWMVWNSTKRKSKRSAQLSHTYQWFVSAELMTRIYTASIWGLKTQSSIRLRVLHTCSLLCESLLPSFCFQNPKIYGRISMNSGNKMLSSYYNLRKDTLTFYFKKLSCMSPCQSSLSC